MSKRKTDKSTTNTDPHEAGCACGPCHNARTSDRGKPAPKLAPNACKVPDGPRGRPCGIESGHAGPHFTGYRWFRDATPPPKRKAGKAKAAPTGCLSRFVSPETGKPMRGGPEWKCDLEPAHEGLHRVAEEHHILVWKDGKAGGVHIPKGQYDDARDRAAGPSEAPAVAARNDRRDLVRVGSEGSWCVETKRGRDPQGKIKDNYVETACGDRVYVTMSEIDYVRDAPLLPPRAPGSGLRSVQCPIKTARKVELAEANLCTSCAFAINPYVEDASAEERRKIAERDAEIFTPEAVRRGMTLEDEPEDPEAEAALAAMDAEARNELDDEDDGDLADDDDPRPGWLKELSAKRREDDEAHAAALDREAAQEEPKEIDPAVGRMDGKDCGVIASRGASRGAACVLDQAHEGEHRAHTGRTWPVSKPRSKKPQADLFGHAPPGGEGEGKDESALIAPTGETITCRGKVYAVHPAARIFPTPEKQYRETVASMARDGQKLEIELLDEPGNPVIDGCSRLRACEELGIEPRTKIIHVAPGEHIRHVVAVNLARRHLDESQRATAAAELATMGHGANQHSRGPANLPVLTQAEAAELLQVSERSVRDAARVRNLGGPEVIAAVREGRIKVSAGAELAKLDKVKQREIVAKVTKGNSEVRPGKVRALVRQEQKRDIVTKINTGRLAPLPEGPFGVIYGDYPWWYDNSDQHEGSRGHMGYPGMKMPEILDHAREVAKRADRNCIVALWFTNLYVREIGQVVDAFGAEHHTMWTWPKPRFGIGTYGRGQTEHLVIASRGKPVHTLNEVSTLLAAYPLREHSRKPDEVADLLAKHCSGPHLELFGREPREGWVVWGAESEGAKAIEPKRKSKILTATDARAAQGSLA